MSRWDRRRAGSGQRRCPTGRRRAHRRVNARDDPLLDLGGGRLGIGHRVRHGECEPSGGLTMNTGSPHPRSARRSARTHVDRPGLQDERHRCRPGPRASAGCRCSVCVAAVGTRSASYGASRAVTAARPTVKAAPAHRRIARTGPRAGRPPARTRIKAPQRARPSQSPRPGTPNDRRTRASRVEPRVDHSDQQRCAGERRVTTSSTVGPQVGDRAHGLDEQRERHRPRYVPWIWSAGRRIRSTAAVAVSASSILAR